MLVPKKNRVAVYSHLFKEGVLVAKHDVTKPKHDSIAVPNLQVIKLLTSLKSRGYVRETYSWGYFYWYLTEEGIVYLREYLHLPDEIVPQTHKKAAIAAPARPAAYGAKESAPSGDFRPRFQNEGGRGGGFGRGGGGGFRE